MSSLRACLSFKGVHERRLSRRHGLRPAAVPRSSSGDSSRGHGWRLTALGVSPRRRLAQAKVGGSVTPNLRRLLCGRRRRLVALSCTGIGAGEGRWRHLARSWEEASSGVLVTCGGWCSMGFMVGVEDCKVGKNVISYVFFGKKN